MINFCDCEGQGGAPPLASLVLVAEDVKGHFLVGSDMDDDLLLLCHGFFDGEFNSDPRVFARLNFDCFFRKLDGKLHQARLLSIESVDSRKVL